MTAKKIRFDGWALDPESGDLEREGTRTRLQEQPALVLKELTAHPGEVVTREQLIGVLWPKGIVDFDTGLNNAVRKLRSALGDVADTPRYIETLPRRGYRFIADLDPDPSPPSEPRSALAGQSKAEAGQLCEPRASGSAARAATNSEPLDCGPALESAGSLHPSSVNKNRPYAAIAAALVLSLLSLAVVRLWTLKQPPRATEVTVPRPPETSIAVLPFADMSENKDQEYFADGLAEELLDLLSKTPGLHVIARTSSFSFKGKSDDIPTIAAKLRVANVLEGSVRKSGNRLRVSTQLVRATDGEHLWAETYDRELKDIFEVQDEIAAAVAAALKLKLSPVQAASGNRSPNVDAYLQYLLGQQYLSRGSAADIRRAVAAYRAAIELDPRYAAAYAGLAAAEGTYFATVTGDIAALDRASMAAARAIELAPQLALGYTARGFLRSLFTFEWTGAEADFDKALKLEPHDATALHYYSCLLMSLGRLSEAVAMGKKALDLDPLSVGAWQYLEAFLMMSGDFAGAREAGRHALAIDPANELALAYLGYTDLLDHKFNDALSAFQMIRGEYVCSLCLRLGGIAMVEHSLGHARESQQALQEAVENAAESGAYQIAQAYAWRGETNKAFEWLERSYRQRDGGLSQLKTDPLLNSLRGDVRYEAMLKKLNLPE